MVQQTYLYKKNNDLVEVSKTGRTASKISGTRRQKEDTLFEVSPLKPDPDLGNWTAWVTDDQLFVIEQNGDTQ